MQTKQESVRKLLQTAAYVAILAWGIRSAAYPISVVLMALLLAYIALPLPQWFIRRFRLGPVLAISWTLVLLFGAYCVFTLAVVHAGMQMKDSMPIYRERIGSLLAGLADYLSRHGFAATEISVKALLWPKQTTEAMLSFVPAGLGLLSDLVLTWLLSALFVAELLDAKHSALGRNLMHYGRDVQGYVAVCAKSGAINSLANLLVYILVGVDFPVFWAFVYFFSNFIPNLGFVISLAPPILLTLLMYGWKKALLVSAGVLITEFLTDFLLQPMLMKKAMDISFLEVTISLIIWSYLLGPAGAILGVPLAIALRKFTEAPVLSAGQPA
jgi:AI-2 transport protein TqsA